jgi:hypothetical protein
MRIINFFPLLICSLLITNTIAIAANNPWIGQNAIFSLLLGNSGQVGKLLTMPVYEDPGGVPVLTAGLFGAMGQHPVKILSIDNPGYGDEIVNQKAGEHYDYYTSDAATIRLMVDLFYPADVDTKQPTVFFISGYRHYHSEQFHSLLYFIASHGYNAIFVSYKDMRAEEADHIKDILTAVVQNPLFSGKIDTNKIGFMGHSLGGGLLFHLVQQLDSWGNGGRFIFTLAGWEAFHQTSKPYILPANTRLIAQTYNERTHDRPNDWDTDPRFSIDYLHSTTIGNSEKTYLYLPGDATHPSSHGTPKTKYNQHGNQLFYYDALQQVGIFRPLHSIMRYVFNIDTVHKEIGLPESSAAMHTVNSIQFYSGDNPYTDFSMAATPEYASNLYAFPYSEVTVAGNKLVYAVNEDMTFSLEKMQATSNDWLGIFPAGSSLVWGNEVAWTYTGGISSGTVTVTDDLGAGNYEAGVFFDDSTTELEAKFSFSVGN